ncbi:MAG: sorbosone dehydrogenase family protein [Desulfobulbaceae bacterium]
MTSGRHAMYTRLFFFIAVSVVFLLIPQLSPAFTMESQALSVGDYSVELRVPKGMRVDFLAQLNEPRFLALGPGDEILSGSKGPRIYRLKKPYTTPETLVTLFGRIHSVAYRDGRIFAAESGGLYVAPYSGPTSVPKAEQFSLVTPLPAPPGGHWSRTVVVGPDKRLYIGLGISGNCSDEYLDNRYPFSRRRGGVFLLDERPGGPVLVPYASGLRNPIGLAFHPDTGVLYATNAGPDNLGFYLPPEVFAPLHHGSFHGMPWFQYWGGAFHDGGCATSQPPRPAGESTPPAVTFPARSTPEGVVFVTGTGLGPEFEGNALVAIHGSWAVPPGGGPETRRPPKIVMVRFASGKAVDVHNVITGFQRPDGSRFTRPCGMLMGPDGNLYFTGDFGEVTGLFRLRLVKPVAAVNSLLLKDQP